MERWNRAAHLIDRKPQNWQRWLQQLCDTRRSNVDAILRLVHSAADFFLGRSILEDISNMNNIIKYGVFWFVAVAIATLVALLLAR
jgi:hypothetical protein